VADRCGSSSPAGRFTASLVLFIGLPCLGLAPVESAPPSFSRSVAVMDFAVVDRSPAPDVARAVTSLAASGNTPAAWLAKHLASNGYEPVGAGRIGRAVQTMGTAAAACADADCAAQLGRMAGAELVVFGKVVKVSDLIWFVEASLVDASRGRILRSEQLELKGDVAQLLPRSMRSMARRFAAVDPGRPELAANSAPGPQEPTLSRDQVLALLAAGNERGPIDLTGRDLSGLDLAGVDFRRADMSRARLVRTRLRGARMHGVKLNDAVATGADLAGAVLDLAALERIDLSGANLHEASLYATILTGAVLVEADLTRARIISAMSGAKLTGAKLAGADLGADPGNQPMGIMRTDATGADLARADLTSANLRKVNFTRADLSGADLTGADVAGADFTGAILRETRGRSVLRGADRAKNLEWPAGD
jgi:uncharacterized protein YjbI with pentapeptide repeats